MISEKAIKMTSPKKISNDIRKWKDSEDLFYSLFPALRRVGVDENINHVDFEFDEFLNVDVKSLKTPHKHGYVLLEFKNVKGDIGWCHERSKAKFFSFQFVDHVIIVAKSDLLALLKEIMPPYRDPEERRNGNKDYEKLLYTYCGRKGRNDVFTYIRKSDLMSIPHINHPY